MIDKKNPTCRYDKSLLIIKSTKKTSEQQKKQYFYTAYYFCPLCKRIYLDDRFRVDNATKKSLTSSEGNGSFDVEIWTDGACSNNGTASAKASWAFVSGKYENAGLVEGKQTNNRGEAFAIYHALLWAKNKGYKKIKIHSDSQITLHGVAKTPDRVKENRDIFEKIYNIISSSKLEVVYIKVLGHSDNENNNRADQLAVALTQK